jgi:hypothetical protein
MAAEMMVKQNRAGFDRHRVEVHSQYESLAGFVRLYWGAAIVSYWDDMEIRL